MESHKARGDGHVERFEPAAHRNSDNFVELPANIVGEACRFTAQNKGRTMRRFRFEDRFFPFGSEAKGGKARSLKRRDAHDDKPLIALSIHDVCLLDLLFSKSNRIT